jgi:hypothetical protein
MTVLNIPEPGAATSTLIVPKFENPAFASVDVEAATAKTLGLV